MQVIEVYIELNISVREQSTISCHYIEYKPQFIASLSGQEKYELGGQ